MSITLPSAITEYFQASNAYDTNAVVLCFAEEAIVHDEKQEHQGRAAIKDWFEASTKQVQAQVEVTGCKARAEETVVTGLVSGSFPGSPVELHFHFRLDNNLIAALTIL